LEQEAKRLGVSINAEVVYRLEKSFKQASAEQAAELIRIVARKYQQVMDDPKVKEFVENLEEAALQGDVIEDLRRR
jgi:hypothetical protein